MHVLIDGHCDAPWAVMEGHGLILKQRPISGPYVQVINTFLSEQMLTNLLQWQTLFNMWSVSLELAKMLNLPLITGPILDNQSGIILGIEGLDFFSGNLAELDVLYAIGYRLFGLTWNRKNLLADGVGVGNSAKGLTQLGKVVVKWCLDKKVILDLAHIAEPGFWDVAGMTHLPLVVSHANCYKLCPHPRNLTDEQIKTLIESGGIIGITFVPEFLSQDTIAVMNDIVRHIDHLLSLGGEDNIGFGSDFGGTDKLPLGISGPESWNNIKELLYKHYSDELVNKIMGLNWLRVINTIFS